MKKLFNGIGTLFILILIVGAFAKPSKTKRFKWKYAILLTLLLFLGCQIGNTLFTKDIQTEKTIENIVFDTNNCVPATLRRVLPQYSMNQLQTI